MTLEAIASIKNLALKRSIAFALFISMTCGAALLFPADSQCSDKDAMRLFEFSRLIRAEYIGFSSLSLVFLVFSVCAISFIFAFLFCLLKYRCHACSKLWVYQQIREVLLETSFMRWKFPYTKGGIVFRKEKYITEYECLNCAHHSSSLKTRTIREK